MASRTSRTSARGSTPAQQRSPSPLSPTKISRTEEKRVLGYLNIRLASYIEKVLNLERLEQQVGPSAYYCEKWPKILLAGSSVEETRTREITSVRGMYDEELSHASRDENTKDQA